MAIAQSLDHFVVPVDDIVAAEEFYVRVFAGVMTKGNGFELQSRNAKPHQATLKMASGQSLILTESPFHPRDWS